MKKILSSVALVMAVAVASPSFAATETREAPYDAPGNVLGIGLSGTILGFNVGGTRFPAENLIPLSVSLADASSTAAAFTVAQDDNGDGFAGDPGEATMSGCGSVDLTESLLPFKPELEIILFIGEDPISCPDGVATTGVATLTLEV